LLTQHGQIASVWGWDFAADLPVLCPLLCLGLAYLFAVLHVNRTHPTQLWPIRHTLFFFIGFGLLCVVMVGPIAHAAMAAFSAHMVQHVVIMMLATPLIVLGAPVLLALRACNSEVRRNRLVPLLRSKVVGVLTNPYVGWLLFALVIIGLHFTPVMSLFMAWGSVGELLEYATYISIAFIYYWPLLPGNPVPKPVAHAARIGSLFVMMVPETMTGFFIYSANFPLFSYFTQVGGSTGVNVVLDQQLGGALMWSSAMIIDVAWISVAVYDWFGSEHARTLRLDRAIAREHGSTHVS